MIKSVYEKLDQKQKGLISEFMRDFIVSEISELYRIFIKTNPSSDGAVQSHIESIGLPDDWEYKQVIEDHEKMIISDIDKYFDMKKPAVQTAKAVYGVDELRSWFEEDLIQENPDIEFVKVVTDNGLEYKCKNTQHIWAGVLLFSAKHKQLINPATGGLF